MSGSPSALPFDDIRHLIATMPDGNDQAEQDARERQERLAKPIGSLGRLEKAVLWMARWQGKAKPQILKPQVALFAANHGVNAHNVSAWPPSVTRTMVETYAAGGGAINQICAAYDLSLKVFELALDVPSRDITVEPAFEEAECAATIAFGMEALAGGTDLLCLGEMGIGNTTIASTLFIALYGGDAEEWVGPGAGADGEQISRKIRAVETALARNETPLKDPLEILRHYGGREIAALIGSIVAARHQNVPVLIDGFVVTAAAAILHAIDPRALDHCLFAHCSAEPAHQKVLGLMKVEPLLDLKMRLGEGTGAAMAAGVLKAAVKTHADMATLEQIGVTS